MQEKRISIDLLVDGQRESLEGSSVKPFRESTKIQISKNKQISKLNSQKIKLQLFRRFHASPIHPPHQEIDKNGSHDDTDPGVKKKVIPNNK